MKYYIKIFIVLFLLSTLFSCENFDNYDYFRFKNKHIEGCSSRNNDDEWVEWFIEGNSLFIIHHNAKYNCCIDDIDIGIARRGCVITVNEMEIASRPCFCTCTYDLQIEIDSLQQGKYFIMIYHGTGYLVETLVIEI